MKMRKNSAVKAMIEKIFRTRVGASNPRRNRKMRPKDQRVESAHNQVSKNCEQDQAQHANNRVCPRRQAHLSARAGLELRDQIEDQIDQRAAQSP